MKTPGFRRPSLHFRQCWWAAGRHLHGRAGDGVEWLKADLWPPFDAHLAFLLGNQLFLVCVEDAAGLVTAPPGGDGLADLARRCNAHACLMPMRRSGPDWVAAAPGWGLLDAQTRAPVDPGRLVTDELIGMSAWEEHNTAVRVVIDNLHREGRSLRSFHADPSRDPAIWIEGDDGPEWVVVRAVRDPKAAPPTPEQLRMIARANAPDGAAGHCAMVLLANSVDALDAGNATHRPPDAAPLWRGCRVAALSLPRVRAELTCAGRTLAPRIAAEAAH